MDENEKPFLILDKIIYSFLNEHTKNNIRIVCDEFIFEGVSKEKVEKLVGSIIDAVYNDI